MGIPVFGDFQGPVGTVGDLLLVSTVSTGPSFPRLSGWGFRPGRWLSIGAIASDDMLAEADGQVSIQRITVVWSVPDRVYLLSGKLSRELAIATANAVE